MKVARTSGQDRNSQPFKTYNPSQNIKKLTNMAKDPIPLKQLPPIGRGDVQSIVSLTDQRVDTSKDSGAQLVSSNLSKEISFDVEDLEIPWSDLVFKERIGAGSSFTFMRSNLQLVPLFIVGGICYDVFMVLKCTEFGLVSGSFGTVHRAEWHGAVSY